MPEKNFDFEKAYNETCDRCKELFTEKLKLKKEVKEVKAQLAAAEKENRIMKAQLDIVHEIFGGRALNDF